MAREWPDVLRFYDELCSMHGWTFCRPLETLVKWASNQSWSGQLFPFTSHEILCVELVPGYNPDLPFFSTAVDGSGQFTFELWMRVGERVHKQTCTPERAMEVFQDFLQLLRRIFGPLPFRSKAVSPSWLSPAVAKLAGAIHDDGDFERTPILADA